MQVEVDARIFGMDFGRGDRIFNIDNIALIPNNLAQSDIAVLGPHIQKGVARVKIEGSDFDKCIDEAQSILFDIDSLLTFAQQRGVFVNDFRCYTYIDHERKLRHRKLFSKIEPVFLEHLNPITVIDLNQIESFLRHCIAKLRDLEFQQHTKVKYALSFFNETIIIKMPLELRYITSFFALEVLASSYATANSFDELLNANEYATINSTISPLLYKIITDENRRSRVLSSLDNLRRETIRQKLRYLFKNYQIDITNEQLTDMLELRNNIVHGKRIEDIADAIGILRFVEDVLRRLIPVIFGFGDD
ncbi:MAG: hypothetical protein HMLIMOIP_000033 [Candidatus Nitrosomirales archaeon]|jgi:hypothetical protein